MPAPTRPMQSNKSRATRPGGGPGRFWRGEENLWKAFWLFWVAGGWAVGAITGLLVQSVGLPHLAAVTLLLLYTLWAGIAVWRCAFNVEWRIWGYFARGIIVVFVMLILVKTVETIL